MHNEASGGIVLLVMTILSLILSNSSFAAGFHAIWESSITILFNEKSLEFTIIHFINDGLMVLFFFVVGLEIKREILVGELSGFKKALLPVIGAAGGMIVPAVIYLLFNSSGAGSAGWAIPVATDIAFVVGILVVLKGKIPTSLRIFLTALAIVDDIGAVIIIAIFYTSSISFTALGFAIIIIVLLMVINTLKIKKLMPYIILGIALWIALLFSGIHATIAGVILAFTIPARSKLDKVSFMQSTKGILSELNINIESKDKGQVEQDNLSVIQAIEKNCENVLTPLQRFEINLHPWITFFIIPLFALANAGVTIQGSFSDLLFNPVGIGIVLGLFIGKQLGVFGFTYSAIKLRLADRPEGSSNVQIYGAAVLAGIGFTMSLFIANLSFAGKSGLMDEARVGILVASIISGFVGFMLLRK
ncbi:MAG: Na+/H+ antiporter NhaA [Ignavibacteriales bacterium]|nr:Na+/H+ antiporter NhaA [Ignavibacteriales bacterium]